MTMPAHPRRDPHARTPIRTTLLRAALAVVLGAATALLISCGGSGAGLIPAGNAGPLQSDFETVASTAQSGNGSCAATEAAIQKTEQDFRELPANVDAGLRSTLSKGIANLRKQALVLCAQPLAQSTVTTSSTQTTSTTQTTPTTTETTPTQTTSTPTDTTPTTSTGSGGTPPVEPAPGTPQGGTEPPSPKGGSGGGQEGGK
jgi:hypothetical protein